MSKDPIMFDGGYNFYEYSFSDPINFFDNDGMAPKAAQQYDAGVGGGTANPTTGGGALPRGGGGFGGGSGGAGSGSGGSGSFGGGGSSGGSCGPITGYTRHGINSAISRADGGSMSPNVILNTVKSPTSVSPNPGGGTIYTGSGGQVILNSRGEVITVIPSGSGSFRGFQP